MGVVASDDFNRADNADLGANWTPVTSEDPFKIVSNKIQPTSNSNDAHERYSGTAWNNDQYSQVVATLPTAAGGGGQGVGVALRCASAARTYYRFVLSTPGDGTNSAWELGRMVAGTFTSITTGTVAVTANAATIYLEAQGTTLIAKVDGVTVATQTDANIGAGSPGVSHSSNTDAGVALDTWVGGDFAAAPSVGAEQFMVAASQFSATGGMVGRDIV